MSAESEPPSPIVGFEDGRPVSGRRFQARPENTSRAIPRASSLSPGRARLPAVREVDSPAADLIWDGFNPEVSFVPNLKNRERLSVSTQFDVPVDNNMDLEEKLAKVKAEMIRIQMVFDDEYKDVTPEDLTNEFLDSRIKTAELMKNSVREATLFLKTQLPDQEEELLRRLDDVRVSLVEFVKLGQKKLLAPVAGQPVHATAAKPGERYKRQSVQDSKEDLLELISELADEIRRIEHRPATEAEYRTEEEKFNLVLKRYEVLSKDADRLVRDAASVGEDDVALDVDQQHRKLKKCIDIIRTYLGDAKMSMGISNSVDSLKFLDLKMPTFSGEHSDLDVYTFIKSFEEFMLIKRFSLSEQVKILKYNSLRGVALKLCTQAETKDEIFTLLKNHWGNPLILFNTKCEEIYKLGFCNGMPSKKREWALAVRHKLNDLHTLCKEHNITSELYFSKVPRDIERSLPAKQRDDFRDILASKGPLVDKKIIFDELCIFLDQFIERLTFDVNFDVQEALPNNSNNKVDASKMTGQSSKNAANARVRSSYTQPKQLKHQSKNGNSYNINSVQFDPKPEKCPLCNQKHTHLFYCEKFQKEKLKERFKLLQENHICFRCLRMDSEVNFKDRAKWWAQHEINCDGVFACKQDRCGSRPDSKQTHILVCGFHVNDNKQFENDFKKSLDQSRINPNAKFFSLYYQVQANLGVSPPQADNTLPDVKYPGIFMTQNVMIENGRELFMFYDGGCAGAAINDKAYQLMKTTNVRKGPSYINVAGGKCIVLEGGDERFHLGLVDCKKMATITAIHMKDITSPFPVWELQAAWNDIESEHKKLKLKDPLPTLPKRVGGKPVDILLGIRYNQYFPKLLFTLPGGLGVFKSRFRSPMGNQCVLGGPHKAWETAENVSNHMGHHVYLTSEARAYYFQALTLRENCIPLIQAEVSEKDQVEEVKLEQEGVGMECKSKHCSKHRSEENWIVCDDWKLDGTIYSLREDDSKFTESQDVGAEIKYRCVRCRNCTDCRKGDILEQASLADEVEQALIESCIKLDVEGKRLITTLPFIKDPCTHLTPNKNIALKVLESQIRLTVKNPEMIADLEKAHHKLLDKGYAMPINSLTTQEREAMGTGDGYYIPWRSVYKEGSLSTPCRMVYDASAKTPGGESLNTILAKGPNSLANLFMILIRFRVGLHGLTTDVAMAYNGIQLDPSHYKYQKYLWRKNLNPESPIEEMVVRTLIYGVRPSGNITTAGFNLAADYCLENYPIHQKGALALKNAAYMDDIADSNDSREESVEVAEGLRFTLGLVSMGVKAFTYSGEDPPAEVSDDGKSLGVLGMLWFPKGDFMTLDKRELYLGKAKRGKRPAPVVGDLSEALSKSFTRRIVHGKVAGIFDPIGLVTPITSKLKLDLNVLCTELKLDWDDQIPDVYLETWVKNLERIQATREIKFRRAVVPANADRLEADLITSVDASQKIAIAVVHARFPLKDGSFSVQLVSAKSKLITTQTVPRAELKAACMGANLGHIVKVCFKDKHKDSIYISDSTIVLFWINQDQRPLHTAVRNGVIDIRRLSSPDSWYHVETHLNIADLGTRKAEPGDIDEDSEWQLGKPWMRLPFSEMPIKTMDEIVMSSNEKREAAVELKAPDISGVVMVSLMSKVAERYAKSKYIPDPARISFGKLFRCRAAVMRFTQNMVRAARRRIAEKRADPEYTNTVYNQKENEIYWSLKKALSESKHRNAVPVEQKKEGQLTAFINFSDEEIKAAEDYYMKKATLEVKEFSKSKDWKDCSLERDGVLYFAGRVLDQDIEDNEGIFQDLNTVSFVKPMLERYSPLSYALMIYAHVNLVQHRNVSATLLESRFLAYIIDGRSLAIEVRSNCAACKRYKAKLLEVEMGKIHQSRLSVSPAFFYSQVDIMGPFTAICEHNHRSSVNIYGVVFKCTATTAVAAYVMQNYSAQAFVQAYTRHASRYGHPKKLFIDAGTQLIKACKDIEFGTIDIAKTLDAKYKVGIEFEVCPVGAHYANGMVERAILEIKRVFVRVYKGLRLDIMSYETAFSWISSELNNMPICLGSKYNDLGHTDLITPARLLLGRNNRRAPIGFASITPPTRLINQLDQVKVAWWTLWKNELLSNFVPQPSKWKTTSQQPKVGDLVIFLRDGHERVLGAQVWRIGRVKEVELSNDGLIRHVIIEYNNEAEDVLRTTRRSVRTIAVLHSEEDLDLVDQLNEASKLSSVHFIQMGSISQDFIPD